jgi:hypothetical protein
VFLTTCDDYKINLLRKTGINYIPIGPRYDVTSVVGVDNVKCGSIFPGGVIYYFAKFSSSL